MREIVFNVDLHDDMAFEFKSYVTDNDFKTNKAALQDILKKFFNISIHFKGKYSNILYKLLKHNIQDEITYTLEELRTKIFIPKYSYQQYSDLKKNVILKAVSEIDKKSEFHLSFEEIKDNQLVTGITFIKTLKKVKQ